MKPLLCAFLLVPHLAFAQDVGLGEITFASTSDTQDYGLYVTAGTGDCPEARYMVLGEGVQVISQSLTPGASTTLRLGDGFAAGMHSLQLSAVGCTLGLQAARLMILNQRSNGHARAPELLQSASN